MKRKLFLLLALMLGFVSGIKAEITSGTDYVIQNVETGQYLAGGNNWGTQACTRDMPQWFKLTTMGSGYSFDSYQSNGGDNHFLNADLYVDGGATEWVVGEVSSGVYTIKNGDNYLASNGKNAACVKVTTTGNAANWKIFSKEELTSSILSNASLTNGVDATPYVKWPDFKKRNLTGTSPWTWTGFDGSGTPSNYAQGDGNGSGSWACAESFQSTTGFKTVQTLTNLKPGWYTLKAHGFYRQDGTDTEHNPYIFVGDKKSYFPVLTGGANNMSTAYSAFLADAHKIYPILFYVNSESDNITIGYANENTKMWNIFGETTLTYYGAEAIDAGTDITGLIANHDFGTGTDKGWEFGCEHGIRVGGAEIWHKNNANVKQQLHGLPSGKYTITCQAIHGEGESANSLLYAKSGSAEKTAQATEPATSSGGVAFETETRRMKDDPDLGKISVDIVVSDGNLEFGFKQTTNVQWDVFTNFTLTYKGEDISDYIEVYENANDVANGIDQESPMYFEVLTALQTAIATYGNKNPEETFETVAEIREAINALNTAAGNATTSISAYASANISAYLTKMTTGIKETNVYTEEAYNKWYANVQSNFDNGVYTNEEAETLTDGGAYTLPSTGVNPWHWNNRIDDVLLSSWTIGGEQCKDYDKALYINNWSVEGNTDGSEFYAPFYEYWTGDNNVLGANSLVATKTGLKANTIYTFSIRARVRQTNDRTKIQNGITMQVGDGDAVDISAGAQFNAGQFYIGNFAAVGETDESGTLTATITVAENSNISWLSFYNCKYTEGEDLSAYIADYEFALNTANGYNLKGMDPKLSIAFSNAVEAATLTDPNTATKQQLIDAKAALDEAMADVAQSVAAFAGSSATGWSMTGNNGNLVSNTWSVEGSTDGSGMTTPFMQNWQGKESGALADKTISYSMTGETSGYYKVTCLVRALNESTAVTPQGVFLYANDNLERAYGANASSCTNGVYGNPIVYGYVGDNGNLTVGFKLIGTNCNWISWKNLQIEYVGTVLTSEIAENQTEEARSFTNLTTGAAANQAAAVSALETLSEANYTAAGAAIEAAYSAIDREFSDLNAAIAAKDDYVLGFEAGEYAPYTGIEAAYAAATAIDQTSDATSQSDINTAASNLSAISANTAEVNAIYWPAYTSESEKDAESRYYALGWGLAGGTDAYNTRVVIGTAESNKGIYNYLNNHEALMTKFNTTYGEETGYTLPLKANTLYKLSFLYGGMENTPEVTVSFTDPESNVITLAPNFRPTNSQAHSAETNQFEQYEGYFMTNAAGNYVLNITKFPTSQQQIAMGNIELKSSADVLEFADDAAVPTYAPGTYPSVKITRTLTANKWATAVYPFAVSGVDNIAVLDSYSSETGIIGFTTAAASTANEPFLMRSTEGTSEISLSNVAVAAIAAEPVVTKDEASLTGVYASGKVPVSEDDNVRYVVSGNQLYKVDSDVNIKPFRAYFEFVGNNEARPVLRFDDTTAINAVEAADANDGALKDGKYLIDGKIVLVKNGVKYGANGQKLN